MTILYGQIYENVLKFYDNELGWNNRSSFEAQEYPSVSTLFFTACYQSCTVVERLVYV